MISSDGVFSRQSQSCSNSSRSGRHQRYNNYRAETTDHGDENDDGDDVNDDDSFKLEDLILVAGNKGGGAAPSTSKKTYRRNGDDHDDVDDDSSMESSLGEPDHQHADCNSDGSQDQGDDENTSIGRGPRSSLTRTGGTEESLNVQKLSTSNMSHQGERGEKNLTPSLNTSRGCLLLGGDTNESYINDCTYSFDLGSSCLSYDYEGDVEIGVHDALGGSEAGNESTRQNRDGSMMPTRVRFSAGKNLHRNQSVPLKRTSSTAGSDARTALQMTPMSRITEHTRESTYNASDLEEVSTGGKENSNYRGGCGRSSITASSGNSSFAEDASSKMS